ncbi:MAG: prephenate dehydratase [Rhodocyclaceae bacterium]|jgi:chorismate mutase/prephenate dehydratase|nr:prephenate dehydratase [Rhodocyclaceae bacterium]
MSDELQRLRAEIDRLDEEVLARLSRRAEIAHEIGRVKGGAVVYRPEREAQVLRRIVGLNQGPLPEAAVWHIFREIMSACLSLEQPLRVVYFGPQGTFTESAAKKHFGSAPQFTAAATIDEVFRTVEAGHADYGVVPVENSTEGAVGRTLDLLLQMPIKICGEVMLRIHQHLLSKAERLEDVKRLYSHAQSLAQCHEWLNHYLPSLPRVPVASNAEAARMASGDAESCAIAGEAAAGLYGLNNLARDIEDDPNNTTRFLVIGMHDAGPSGRDKTSLVCASQNKAGAMYALLEPLARHGVSMSKFESRPSRAGLWEYVFYVDVEGHQSEERVGKAFAELRDRAAFVKILGSYPGAVT